MAFVYMLRCRDGPYYVGLTRRDDLDERIGEYQSGTYDGYRLSAIRPSSVFGSIGFRNGDIVRSVNGIQLVSVGCVKEAQRSVIARGMAEIRMNHRGTDAQLLIWLPD